jgi:hypothetical protein
MRRSHLPPEHWMQHVTCPSAIQSVRPPGGYLPVHLACRCEAIANDSAADDMTQIINPLGIGTRHSYCASWLRNQFLLLPGQPLSAYAGHPFSNLLRSYSAWGTVDIQAAISEASSDQLFISATVIGSAAAPPLFTRSTTSESLSPATTRLWTSLF